ncbi:MAG: hypothetical protein AB8B56_06910 [Crocinitomicaceae bacterium]
MKKSTHYATIALVFLSFSCFGQTNTPKTEHALLNTHFGNLTDQEKLKDLVSIHDGTYQLRVTNANYSPLLTLETLTLVSENRLQNTNQVFSIDSHTTLYLPSFDQIESESFTDLETVVYLSPLHEQTD